MNGYNVAQYPRGLASLTHEKGKYVVIIYKHSDKGTLPVARKEFDFKSKAREWREMNARALLQ